MLTKSDHVDDTDKNASKKLIQYPYEAVPILTIALLAVLIGGSCLLMYFF